MYIGCITFYLFKAVHFAFSKTASLQHVGVSWSIAIPRRCSSLGSGFLHVARNDVAWHKFDGLVDLLICISQKHGLLIESGASA
jgi:hypothetical protein